MQQRVWPDGGGDPAYLSKYVSIVRRAMSETVDAAPSGPAKLRRLIHGNADEFTSVAGIDVMATSALLRQLIKARKKVGFRLLLPKSDIALL